MHGNKNRCVHFGVAALGGIDLGEVGFQAPFHVFALQQTDGFTNSAHAYDLLGVTSCSSSALQQHRDNFEHRDNFGLAWVFRWAEQVAQSRCIDVRERTYRKVVPRPVANRVSRVAFCIHFAAIDCDRPSPIG